jgi:hypothetical protein
MSLDLPFAQLSGMGAEGVIEFDAVDVSCGRGSSPSKNAGKRQLFGHLLSYANYL